jgi:N-acetyl-gamma-glutamylphosphate reductase
MFTPTSALTVRLTLSNLSAVPQEIISQLPRHIKVVDLSADFRLKDINTYAEWCAPCLPTRL